MQPRVSNDRDHFRIAHGLVVITAFALIRLASHALPRGPLGLALGVKEKANLREVDEWFAAHAPNRKPTP
ncbi:MAG TPA: hypothetical protein VHB97_17785 [Polyangia bacterium]|jgi:hypothetical protein|nr:hypothetical protein [Polyangia bacterium]